MIPVVARSLAAWLVVGTAAIACSRAEAPTPPTATSTAAAATATRAPTSVLVTPTSTLVTASPTPTGAASTIPAPTNVRLTGRLPNLTATVPAGEGEAGRVTIEWDAPTGPAAFRVYMQDCAGTVARALEVTSTERRYGPLQPCRPGGKVGVAAFTSAGESAIVWAP